MSEEASNVEALVAGALEKLGVKQAAAEAGGASAGAAPSAGGIDYEKLADMVAAKLGSGPAATPTPPSGDDQLAAALLQLAGSGATVERYRSPGAPSGAPQDVLERDATRWSRDYVERLQSDGTFLKELEKFRGTLPGGGGGLFRKRIPTAR